jgi:uncharacterized OsmC-like protein
MTSKQRRHTLGETHARNIRKLELRPRSGTGTATTIARSRGAVACDITDGAFRIVSDLGEGQGGEGLGPDPGILLRAALAACMVGGYQMWAAYMDVQIDDIEVVVEADYDARGMYAVGNVEAGYSAVRVRVRIDSPAPEERVLEMVTKADTHSPILYDFTTALEVAVDVTIGRPAAQEA